MSSASDPLSLNTRLTATPKRFPWLVIVDIILILLGLYGLSSFYLFAPGVTVELPVSYESVLPGLVPTAVMTIPQENMILYKGKIYNLTEVEVAIQAETPLKEEEPSVLLIKPNKQVTVQTLMAVCEIAHRGGYRWVQIASNTKS